MFTFNYTVPEKENKSLQVLMDAFLWSVDMVCYDVDLNVFRFIVTILRFSYKRTSWNHLERAGTTWNHQ